MSYIDRNLLPDEKIIFRTKKHLVIFFWPLVWLILLAIAANYMSHQYLLAKLVWAPWAVVALLWAHAGLEYMTSEFVVTNKRVMMREGLFTRHSNEVRLGAIAQVNVDQSLIGQMLNYGNVSLN